MCRDERKSKKFVVRDDRARKVAVKVDKQAARMEVIEDDLAVYEREYGIRIR